ncbi:MAG: hypothetical protein GXP45_06500 [bacterium]|nr:hypothetical protein [bacterium]
MKIKNIPELDGIIIWAQPDMGIILPAKAKIQRFDKPLTHKTYIIYDRKSGQKRDAPKGFVSDQLKTYAYKMLLKIGLDQFEQIDIYCYEVFLKSGDVLGGKIQREDIYHIQQKISLDVNNQKQLLVDQNPIKNKALPSEYFHRTEQKYKCKSCRFRKVCDELTRYEETAFDEKFFK